MRRKASKALASAFLALALAAGLLVVDGGSPAEEAVAQNRGTSLSNVLGQLRRNAKVSERLNAGFFRAPQTRAYVGSAFQPVDSDIAYTVGTNSALSLKPTAPGTRVVEQGGNQVVQPVAQTTGTFELPLDIPNRAQVVKVQASYTDAAGGGSGFGFSVLSLDQTGGSQSQLLQLPAGANPALGFRSSNGQNGTFSLPIAGNGFRVNNSTNRYVLRVRIDDTSQNTQFYGLTIQYVIGRGVPGAPGGTNR